MLLSFTVNLSKNIVAYINMVQCKSQNCLLLLGISILVDQQNRPVVGLND